MPPRRITEYESMKALIIGFGSIGKRHFSLLASHKSIETVSLVTSQIVRHCETFDSVQNVRQIDAFDYFVIATVTTDHLSKLQFLDQHVKGKIVLIENPLFHKPVEYNTRNTVFVGYNLRYHPLMERLFLELNNERIVFFEIVVGQYLPFWNPDRDCRSTYSASKALGGGVLRDLTHELDYLHWLFGKIRTVTGTCQTVSSLEIDAEDLVALVGTTDRGIVFNLRLDYLSRKVRRQITVYTESKTIEADLIHGEMTISQQRDSYTVLRLPVSEQNQTYVRMHDAILSCSPDIHAARFDDGMEVMRAISLIEANAANFGI
jgi:CMP-N,N'-diacetyllegionaminic acid synthase